MVSTHIMFSLPQICTSWPPKIRQSWLFVHETIPSERKEKTEKCIQSNWEKLHHVARQWLRTMTNDKMSSVYCINMIISLAVQVLLEGTLQINKHLFIFHFISCLVTGWTINRLAFLLRKSMWLNNWSVFQFHQF